MFKQTKLGMKQIKLINEWYHAHRKLISVNSATNDDNAVEFWRKKKDESETALRENFGIVLDLKR